MLYPTEFDDLRPYTDAEIPAAMARIAASEWLPQLAAFVFPDKMPEAVAAHLLRLNTIEAFQREVMHTFNAQVIARSIDRFTCEGLQRLSPDTPYLFVSNHRDIVLDASLLQSALLDSGCPTAEITFGANLMCHPLVVDIGRSNRMFRVERAAGLREFYRLSLHLSRYLHHVIGERRRSVWIAQRNGRTKDGWDATDHGLLKMFVLGSQAPALEALAGLHIVPVAVSYEWEPCDLLTVRETAARQNGPYVKQPGEDLHSILTGIRQPKGHVHFHLAPPLTAEDYAPFARCSESEALKAVAALIDRRIAEHYRIMPTTYLAHDLLHAERRYADRYTDEVQALFEARMATLDTPDLRSLFLHLYARPLLRRRALLSSDAQ